MIACMTSDLCCLGSEGMHVKNPGQEAGGQGPVLFAGVNKVYPMFLFSVHPRDALDHGIRVVADGHCCE